MQQHSGHEHDGMEQPCPTVEEVPIRIDDKAYLIHRGHHPVSNIKELGKVPPEYVLDQVQGCHFHPLPDGGIVEIKDGEIFFSHTKRGGTS